MRNMRNVNPTKKTQMMINGWNTVSFVWPLSWSTDAECGRSHFLRTCLRNRNGCSPQKSAFIMIYYYSFMILGISDQFVFYQFQPFFLLSRQSPPTDWPTLFEVNLVPRAFSFRKWLEDTRLEVTLAQGKGGGGREGRRGYSLVFLVVRMGSPVLHILNLFQTKYALFHTHFQTCHQNTEYW